MALFEFNDLNFTYPGHDEPALRHISFDVSEGEFLVICGKSGCGKSTLLRHFKTAITPYGSRSGQILFEGHDLAGISVREQASRIGFVLQSPDNQIVTDKVWH
ncbi:MAG: ATP-binding cassette domain-containing protein, partial [Firmicutes bacterium]|nr:ATP-binding cassette domain-containing protein [Bacillota bacterium]